MKHFVAKTIRWEGMTLVNLCDEELLGATVRDADLELHISKDHFGGEVVDEPTAVDLVRSCTIANLVGDRIISRVLEAKLASELAVKKVGPVAFLMIFKFQR